MTWTEISLLVMASCMLATTLALIGLAFYARNAARVIKAQLKRMVPAAQEVLQGTTATLHSINAVAGRVGVITAKADAALDQASVPLMEEIRRIRNVQHHVRAIFTGTKAGVVAFRESRAATEIHSRENHTNGRMAGRLSDGLSGTIPRR